MQRWANTMIDTSGAGDAVGETPGDRRFAGPTLFVGPAMILAGRDGLVAGFFLFDLL